jgi:ABC-type glycerol-3-phosphate transport system substrate-binding protein
MKKSWILALCAAAALAGCGGGGDHTPPATESVPASASASPDGFIGYLKALVASAADMLEPVDVSAVTPPADDTGEPTPVN